MYSKILLSVAILSLAASATAQQVADTIVIQTAKPKPIPPPAQSPKAYLNGIFGYTFDESFSVDGYTGMLQEGSHYGGSIEFVIPKFSTPYSERTLELSYQGMSTNLEGYSYLNNSYQPKTSKAMVNYLMLGFNNYAGKTRKIMGYGGLNLGVGWVTNKDNDESVTKFAIGLKLGGRFMFSDNVGLKIYTQLNTIVGAVGGGMYFGTGGAGAGVSTYSSVTQFGLGGGLTIGLGGAK
jgi:hypothetical protein